MCGLLGIAGDITFREIDAFKELLYISSLRGWDSTGAAVFTRKTDGDPFQATVVKTVGSGYSLLDSRQFEKAISQTNKKILMGHTRAATVGNVRLSNAHPFEFKKYVGAHNGTLDYSSRRELPFHAYFETDSEALISSINDHGFPETMPKMEGAWALSLVNKEDGTLQFLRNNQRDLCFCFNKAGTTLFWASEPQFLRFILARKNIDIREDKVFRFAENMLYTYDVPLNCGKFAEPERSQVKGKTPALFMSVNTGGTGANYNNEHGHGPGHRTFESARTVLERTRAAKEQTDVVKLHVKHMVMGDDDEGGISLLPKFHGDFYETRGRKKREHKLFIGWSQRLWDENLFKKQTSCGCAFCKEVPKWGDNIVFCRSDAFTCQKCSGDDGIEESIRQGVAELPVMSVIEAASNENSLNDPLPTIN